MSAARTHRRGVIEPTIFALVVIAILIGLGIWQLDRKVWKENLIATVTARLAQAPQDLPPRADWTHLVQADNEYRRVAFPAEFLPGEEALVYSAGSAFRPDVQGTGYWVFAPARLAGGSIVVVDRGFIPLEAKGMARRAPTRHRRHCWRHALAGNAWPVHARRRAAEQYLVPARSRGDGRREQMVGGRTVLYRAGDAGARGGLPKPGKLTVNLPDNHLQYAITWFGLALGLAGVYVVFIARRLGERG